MPNSDQNTVNFQVFHLLFGACTILLFLTGCGSSYSSQISSYLSVEAEESFCNTSVNYPQNVSVIGTAKFEKRTINVTTETTTISTSPLVTNVKLKNMALTDPLPDPLPIKFAEVSVYNSRGQRIQCGVTNENGEIKSTDFTTALKIPAENGTYRIRVTSRSFIGWNNNIKDYSYISVKQEKYRNKLYELNSNFTINNNTVSSVSLLARARQTDSELVEAGAFNILNSIYTAYSYIKTNTTGTDTTCLSNKLSVYWKAGFNPIQYVSPDADPQTLASNSYYSNITKELYITGGQLGDMSLSNTDHFDDFAIIHEFGHFVEDHCGLWTSPGGDHALLSRIDPRLAWSESWANYLAATVIKNKIYEIDPSLTDKLAVLTENSPTNNGWTYFFNSLGFSDSVQNVGNGNGFFIDFKLPGTNPGSYSIGSYIGQEFDKVQPSIYPGEGHTREGAISRGLFKVSNSCTGQCASTPLAFNLIWKAFDRITGLGKNQNTFGSSDQFFESLKTISTDAIWTSGSPISPNKAIENEALHLVSNGSFSNTTIMVWPGYAKPLVTGKTCELHIQPRSDSALNRSSSDQRYSNHFYTIDLSLLSGLNQISVTFSKLAGSDADHDIILFKPNYFFNDDYTCTTFNSSGTCNAMSPYRGTSADIITMNREPATTLGTSYSKTIDINNLNPQQKYLLDLRAWTAGLSLNESTEYSYTINSNLGVLCP